MPYSIQVSANPGVNQWNPSPFFIKQFNSLAEFQAVASLCDNKNRVDFFKSLIFPVRTNSLNDFCRDFFFPTLVDCALNCNGVALKIFLCIACTILDILTFPIRLITLIPRYFYNAVYSKETHPLYQYLVQNEVPPANLSSDFVHLKLKWTEGNGQDRIVKVMTETFNFIELPITASDITFPRKVISLQ